MTKDLKLYCFAQSGNAYKVALFLALAGTSWEPVFVDFFKGETRSEGYRKINPMGEVPVLAHKNKHISQSGVILQYLSTETGMLKAPNEDLNLEIQRWLLWDNYKLTPNLATGRYMSIFLPREKRDVSVINFLLGRVKMAMKVLDDHLEKRKFVVGGQLTIADLSIAGYIFFTEEFEFDMSPYPNVINWKNNLSGLKNWKHPYDLMPGHPL